MEYENKREAYTILAVEFRSHRRLITSFIESKYVLVEENGKEPYTIPAYNEDPARVVGNNLISTLRYTLELEILIERQKNVGDVKLTNVPDTTYDVTTPLSTKQNESLQ